MPTKSYPKRTEQNVLDSHGTLIISHGELTGGSKYTQDLARKHKPKLLIAGASSYSRTLDFKTLSEISRETGAYFLADIAHIAGLIATGYHPSPLPYADFVTSTTHKTLRGPRGGMIMCRSEYAKAIDKVVFPGMQGGPLMHVIAAKAVAFKEALTEEFKRYQLQIVRNAQELADVGDFKLQPAANPEMKGFFRKISMS